MREPVTSTFGRAHGTYHGLQVQHGVEGGCSGIKREYMGANNVPSEKMQRRGREDDGFWTLRYDGASQGNPGLAGAGCVLETTTGDIVYEIGVGLGVVTNNAAEYLALIYGMRTAVNLGVQFLRVFGDSQLVTCQVNGEWKVGSEMGSYHREVILLSRHLGGFEINWVPRIQNQAADQLASIGLLEPGIPFVSEFPEGGSGGVQVSVV